MQGKDDGLFYIVVHNLMLLSEPFFSLKSYLVLLPRETKAGINSTYYCPICHKSNFAILLQVEKKLPLHNIFHVILRQVPIVKCMCVIL
jgi:hypothetical protein